MTTLADPKDLLAEHTSALTAYAERVFGRHAQLLEYPGHGPLQVVSLDEFGVIVANFKLL